MEDLLEDQENFYPYDAFEIPDPEPEIDPQPKKQRRRIFLRVVTILVLLSWVCGATGLANLLVDGRNSQDEQPAVLQIVDQYMRYMQVNNAEDAYQLLSIRQQQFIALSDLEAQLDGINHVPFEGYHHLRVKQFNIRARLLSGIQLLPGTAAEIICDVAYLGGLTGEINALLEKQNGEWKLAGIKITAPPDKYRKILRF